MIEKWTRYCGGSRLLAWLIIVEAAMWIFVTILFMLGHLLHFSTGLIGWLTLPSLFNIFVWRPWTLMTYMAVHFDFFHVLFNLLWLYWFGRYLLITDSDKTLALYFFGGGIFGGVIFLIGGALGWSSGWLCGCSAAVIAVMCGAAFRHPNVEIGLFLIGNVKLKWVAAACCLLTFIGGGGNQAAHVGGLLWGLMMGMLPYFNKMKYFGFKNQTRVGADHYPLRRKRTANKVIKALSDHRSDMERLDQLLDKIKLSGYDSLSSKERKELNELSKRIKTH